MKVIRITRKVLILIERVNNIVIEVAIVLYSTWKLFNKRKP